MTPWVIVPVKRFASSKTRLAGLFDADQRIQLAEAMLRDTLGALAEARGLAGIALVTADPLAERIGRAAGALILDDHAPNLNSAVNSGREQLFSRLGRSALLVLPIDLPALCHRDVESVMDEDGAPDRVILVPDRRRDGTNALLLGEDADLPFAYGPGSFARHIALAEAQGLRPAELTVPRMALDFDEPNDLGQILNWPIGDRTKRLLDEIYGVGRDAVECAG